MSEFINVKVTYTITVVEEKRVYAGEDFPDGYGWEDLDSKEKKHLERDAQHVADTLYEHVGPVTRGLFQDFDRLNTQWPIPYTIEDVT